MRAVKMIGYGIGAVIALLVIVVLIVRLAVNPNAFKSRIIASVKSSTGRQLSLPGDIKLSLFPWAALELGPASLGSPPEFGGAPFASVRHVALSVKLLPLLHKRLDVGRIEISGLDLQLSKNAAGHGNWQLPPNERSTVPPAPSAPAAARPTLPQLAGVTIKDSRISYQDVLADKLQVDIGPVQSSDPISVSASLQLSNGPDATPLPVSAKFQLRLDPATQALAIPGLTVQIGAAHLTGSINGTHVLDAPNLQGRFNLEPISPRELMQKLDITPPATRDPKVFSNFLMSGAFALSHNALRLTDLSIQLDDSRLRGTVSVDDLDSKATGFNLVLDQIDLDRYRSADAGGAPAATKPAAAKPTAASTDSLKTLDFHGTAQIARARVSGITLTNVTVGLEAKDALIRLAPIAATLYGGSGQGELTLDGRGAVPNLKLQQSLSNVDVAQLLNDFANTQRLSGRGELTLNLNANGLDTQAMLRSLNGRVSANLAGGAVEGIDIGFQINRALALIRKQAAPAGSDTGRTPFDVFKASADIAHGVATTKDLTINSGVLRVTGQGSANLPTEAINYRIQASVLKSAAAVDASSVTLAEVPMLVTGTMKSPSVRPDLPGMAKARVQQELDQHKDELKQKLQDQLKGLLGK
ncbi:MAG TPA: AsmA family protein [Steroidobacteraceae bacterium]|jgi:AsmA protein